MDSSVFERFTEVEDGIEVELLVQPAMNYALVHNRVPAVRHLRITNVSGALPATSTVTLELTGPQGRLCEPWTRRIPADVAASGSTSWDEFDETLPDAPTLRAANEAFPAVYAVTVTRPGHADVRLSARSLVLAHNEWFNTPVLYDSLAAFVQPNTAAVQRVLGSAADILLRQTGSGTIDGYGSGPERAARVAGAVYEALRGWQIHYQTVPASFENTGQKIRSTAMVLKGRMGNCVDLSVTYAACLEAAGLHPLVWITEDHAFAGFFLAENRLNETVCTETNLLVTLVESGRAVPVELTCVGPGSSSLGFAEAVRRASGLFRADLHRLRGVLDVHLAHRSGVRPLPTPDDVSPAVPAGRERETAPAQPAGSIDLPAETARIGLRVEDEDAEAHTAGDTAPQRIRTWKKALLDLSLRNPLLNLPKRGKGLNLHVPKGMLGALDDIAHAGKPVRVIAQDALGGTARAAGAHQVRDLDAAVVIDELTSDHRVFGLVTEDAYVKRMRALQREARTMEQETGSNYLYLTLGSLVHPKASGGEAHAPLFLLPVRIEGGTGRRAYEFIIDGTGIAAPNYCLIEWLRVRHGVRIPELEDPALDDSGIDVERALADIARALLENNLNYRVDETAGLRLLQFSTFQMWRDLRDHWSDFMANPVVRHLVESPGDSFTDPAADGEVEVDEGTLHLPIPADGSQMRAVVMAERGRSFVLEGPPGTGKSQTITNLIARAITSGRSVLFVAEKQAALDVVKKRLKAVGLEDFTLDVHGRKQSMAAIRAQLKNALERRATTEESSWRAIEANYRARLAPLADYPERVHSANAMGLSAWSAYDVALAQGDGPEAKIPAAFCRRPAQQREEVELALRGLPAAARAAGLRPRHPWSLSGRQNTTGIDVGLLTRTAQRLEQLRTSGAGVREGWRRTLAALDSPDELAPLLPAVRLAAEGRLLDSQMLIRTEVPGWSGAIDQLRRSLQTFQHHHSHALATFQPDVFTAAPLDELRQEAQRAEHAMLGKAKKRQQAAARLAPFLAPGGQLPPEHVLAAVEELSTMRDKAAALHQSITRTGGLLLPPWWLPTAPGALDDFDAARQAAVTARELARSAPEAWLLARAGVSVREAEYLRAVHATWDAWTELLGTDKGGFGRWAGKEGWYAAWQRDGAAWVRDLLADGLHGPQRWGLLLTHMDKLEEAELTAFSDQIYSGQIPPESAEIAFLRGVAATALRERLDHGGLTYFDAASHEQEITEFDAARRRLQSELPGHLASTLVRNRPFAPEQRRGPAGELAAQIGRTRGGLSFRELFARYSDTITALTPCFLMSPASVANYLPADSAHFDVVVFDEASQIGVAQAVGVMGRGRSVVVVGDSRQMPPSSIMQVSRPEEEFGGPEEEFVLEDLESILSESVESGLPQEWLSWHYRSREESLISFSNRHYYEGRLSSLPSPGIDSDAGVTWRRVDGSFDRGARASRTNEVEARAVVAEITRRLRDPRTAGHSIGVVTFNVPQRDLILNLLEESADHLVRESLNRPDGESTFVKNLENVQGDERDVILFSLAFSPDPQTGVLPLNFGPLSRTGGERRLNVAITRARRLVVLFSSFDPRDIDLARTSAVGTQHLRAYLEMAAEGAARLGDLAPGSPGAVDRVLEEIASAVTARGHEVATHYGLSDFTVDLAVRAPGSEHWQVAVMLDGPRWRARPTVADREGAPALLEPLMGWPRTVRVWLPAWIQSREETLERIDEALEDAARVVDRRRAAEATEEPFGGGSETEERVAVAADEDRPVLAPEPVAPVPALNSLAGTVGVVPFSVVVEADPSEADEAAAVAASPVRVTAPAPVGVAAAPAVTREAGASVFAPYRAAQRAERSEMDGLESSARVRGDVRELIAEIVAHEGPVERQRLARLVLECYGFQKSREDRKNAVLRLVDADWLCDHREYGVFVWPPSLDRTAWRGFRGNRTSTDRRFEEIAPEEIANAHAHAIRGGGMGEGELLRATLDSLGFRRKTENIEARLRYGLDVALRQGLLYTADGRYSAPGAEDGPVDPAPSPQSHPAPTAQTDPTHREPAERIVFQDFSSPLAAVRAPDPAVRQPSQAVPQPPVGKGTDSLGGRVVASETMRAQRAFIRRAPTDTEVAALIDTIAEAGGKAPVSALCRTLGVPGSRWPGFFAQTCRLLNVSGYPVLSGIDQGNTVELNTALLREQFRT